MQDVFSKQFTKNRKIKMTCWVCANSVMTIVRKSCQNINDEYKACMIVTECEKCSARDDFFINKDYYGYIDSDAKPLKGDWKI